MDYVFQFDPHLRTFSASCQGKIYPTGVDPFDPSTDTGDPIATDTFTGRRVKANG